jgi:hypothetical protein
MWGAGESPKEKHPDGHFEKSEQYEVKNLFSFALEIGNNL